MRNEDRDARTTIRRTTIGAAALCALALMAPAAASATVRYAAPSGGLTSGDCTTEETACEVNRAVETVAASGDEVILEAGVYEIGADQLFIPPNVNVHGESAARHTEVTSTGIGHTVALNNDGGRIADVTLTHNTGQFGSVSLSSQSLVERVVARSSLANVQACQLWKGTIRDTVCWASGASATAAGTSLAGPAGTHTPQLRNVTAIGTGTGSTGVSFHGGGGGVNVQADLRNVIADGPAGDISAYGTNGGTASVNAASSMFIQTVTNPGGGATPGTITANNAQGNVPTSATFINRTGGDFHQKPNSLSIDRGTSESGSGIGTADFDGQGRVSGEEVDIGADEFIDNDVRYAEPNGNGPEPCVEADPCDIRNAAGGNASDGDEVVVPSGSYQLDNQGLEITEAVEVRGPAPGAQPAELHSTATYSVYVGDPGAVLSDVQVDAGSSGLFLQSGTVERTHFRTSDPGSNACMTPGGLLRDSVCFSDGALNGGGAGINYSGGTHSPKLRNVTAIATGANSSGLRFHGSGGAVINVDARNVIASGVFADVSANASTGATSTIDIDHSNYATVQRAGDAVTVPDPGTLSNQIEEPLFADAAAGDFHQQQDSPTVDKGTSDTQVGSTDVDGESRSQGPAVDIGADELTVVPLPPDDKVDTGKDAVQPKQVTPVAAKCKKRKAKGGKRKRCKKRKRR